LSAAEDGGLILENKLLHTHLKFLVSCQREGNWKALLILNISQVGDGDKTEHVLGRRCSTFNSLLTVPWEAVCVQRGGGLVFAQRQVFKGRSLLATAGR